jgi:hypothetical protein
MAHKYVRIPTQDSNAAESRYQIYIKIMNTRNILQFLSESIGERGNSAQDEFALGLEQVLLDQVARLDECMESEDLGQWSLPEIQNDDVSHS